MTKYRIWGGWLLVILGISVLMTMGCEKGALGVRPGTVVGTFVNSTTNAPIAGVRVQVVSEAGQSTGGQGAAIGQQYIAMTDASGRFAVDNLLPDKLALLANHPSYQDFLYPPASITPRNFFINNGQVLDLGNLEMIPTPTAVPNATITVRLILRDSITRDKIAATETIRISFDEASYIVSVAELESGLLIPAKGGSYEMKILADTNRYLASNWTVDGTGNIVRDIYLTPLSYNVIIRCVNVPDYIAGAVVRVLAEMKTNTGVPKVIATQTVALVADPIQGTGNSPVLPNLITISKIALPVDIRIQIRGYQDEVISILDSQVASGSQGNIRIDADFTFHNSTAKFNYHAVTNNIAGMFDNRHMRPVILRAAGKDLFPSDYLVGHVYNYGQVWDPAIDTWPPSFVFDYNALRPPAQGPINQLVPVGYEQHAYVSVYPTNGPDAASGSYTVGAGTTGTFMVNPDNEFPPLIFRDIASGTIGDATYELVTVNCTRP